MKRLIAPAALVLGLALAAAPALAQKAPPVDEAARETLERMWTSNKTPDGKDTHCGYGCFIISTDEGDRRIFHSGGQPKVSTFLIFSPERKTAVCVMCNLRNTAVNELAGELMKIAQAPAQ